MSNSSLKLKVCGMRDPDNIRALIKLQPDFIGFIFHPGSPRYVIGHLPPEIARSIPSSINKVGVFVNEDLDDLPDLISQYNLDIIQLHGNESPAYCGKVRKMLPVIKAFSISPEFNFETIKKYEGKVDYFLFDTKTNLFGGSGQKFNWDQLKNYKFRTPYFLSGGVDERDVDIILEGKFPRCFAVDINSRFEIEPGVKDIQKIKDFKEKLNRNISSLKDS